MAFDPRAQRVKVRVRVQLEDEVGKDFYGLTNDISESGFSAFLRCKEDFVIDEVLKNAFVQINFPKLESLFFDRKFRTVFNLEGPLRPMTAEVVRVENSWIKGFEVFVACRFLEVEEEDRKTLADYIATRREEERQDTSVVYAAESPTPSLDVDSGETLRFEFPGRYLYLPLMCDMVERLATQVGFGDLDVFKIKVATDEILANAFKHGCPAYAENKIALAVTLDRKGVMVRVRDEGGILIEHQKYRGETPEGERRTGLGLVDRFVDGWGVETVENESTEVFFVKHRRTKPARNGE